MIKASMQHHHLSHCQSLPWRDIPNLAVGVGQMYSTVPSTVHAEFRQTNASIKPNFESLQKVQIAEQFCSYLHELYTVKSANSEEDINLTVQSSINKEVLVDMNRTLKHYLVSPMKQFHNLISHTLATLPTGIHNG